LGSLERFFYRTQHLDLLLAWFAFVILHIFPFKNPDLCCSLLFFDQLYIDCLWPLLGLAYMKPGHLSLVCVTLVVCDNLPLMKEDFFPFLVDDKTIMLARV
jgi:hypothetical protein